MSSIRKHRHRCVESSSSKHRRGHHDDPRDEVREEELAIPNAEVVQEADQFAAEIQESDEVIFIKDSCEITVHTTVNEVAASLQIAVQLALALVIKITIGDSDDTNSVLQELLQQFDSDQKVVQKIYIENSKGIEVTTTDNQLAVNIQALLQVLLTLVAKLDIG